MTHAPQLSGHRHIFVTPVAAVSLLLFPTCAFICHRISCFCLDPGFFVTHFHAPISKACHDTLPFDHRFCLSTWSNFHTNRGATKTSTTDISAQTMALLLSAVSIVLATRTKSLTLLPVASVRWTSWEWNSSLRSQDNISPSFCSMHLGNQAATYCLATQNHLLQLQSLSIPYRQAIF